MPKPSAAPDTIPIPTDMQIYTVGGAVRDSLLGLPVKDRDFVVVGATPEQMVALGYTPVGKDFPVFLHPQTHDEYALARTERKTAPGYRGFVFHADGTVTLEQDLVRRDLTINAMALAADGTLVDPFGGQTDLAQRLFRHVSDAFAEDPVRILRVARFAARFNEFTVDPSTNALMQSMVIAGEVDALVPERVWQELARGLMEAQPSRMIEVLRDCGALARLLPELDDVWNAPTVSTSVVAGTLCLRSIDIAAQQNTSLPIRVALLLCPLAMVAPTGGSHATRTTQLIDAIASRLKIPNDCRDLALMTVREHSAVHRVLESAAADLVALVERCDGLRKPERFFDMLQVIDSAHRVECDQRAAMPQRAFLATALAAARAVDAGAIAGQLRHSPELIPQQVRNARIEAVERAIATLRAVDATQLLPRDTNT